MTDHEKVHSYTGNPVASCLLSHPVHDLSSMVTDFQLMGDRTRWVPLNLVSTLLRTALLDIVEGRKGVVLWT